MIARASRGEDAVAAFLLCALVAVLVTAVWGATRRTLVALAATTAITTASLLGYWWLARWAFVASGDWYAVVTPCLGAR